MTNPRCAAGDSTSSPFAPDEVSVTTITSTLVKKAKPMRNCTAFSIAARGVTAFILFLRRCAFVCLVLRGRKCHAGHRLHPYEVILHALDADDVFDCDNEALTLAIVGYDSVQLSD